jgi:hypothetical protein
VITVLQRAAAQGLDWQAAEDLSDRELAARLFPQGEGKPVYTMPDYDWVHREMSKPGVTLQPFPRTEDTASKINHKSEPFTIITIGNWFGFVCFVSVLQTRCKRSKSILPENRADCKSF